MKLAISGLVRRYGNVAALGGIDLDVAEGEFLTILGPSGSGKTTLLKSVAGFETPDAGAIVLGTEDVTLKPPKQRDVGMVFQNYALFPHMTVAQNVAFPLEMRRRGRDEIAQKVSEVLRLVELDALGERLPRQLSGGQQQRVALARAVVFGPRLLLLDEPFGALDRKLRENLQLEVRRLQRKMQLTTLFITHDQEEALIMSDRIAVMNRGMIQQVGVPSELYDRPKTRFVAEFLGESNLIEAVAQAGQVQLPGFGKVGLAQVHDGAPICLLIRPEAIRLGPEAEACACRTVGTIFETSFLGQSAKFRIRVKDDLNLLARVPLRASTPPPVSDGDEVVIGFAKEDIHVIHA